MSHDTLYVRLDGEFSGPWTVAEVLDFVRQGILEPMDPVRHGTEGTWTRVNALPGFGEFGPAVTTAEVKLHSVPRMPPSPTSPTAKPNGRRTPSEIPQGIPEAAPPNVDGSLFFVWMGGQAQGPFTLKELSVRAEREDWDPLTFVREGDSGTWRLLHSLLERRHPWLAHPDFDPWSANPRPTPAAVSPGSPEEARPSGDKPEFWNATVPSRKAITEDMAAQAPRPGSPAPNESEAPPSLLDLIRSQQSPRRRRTPPESQASQGERILKTLVQGTKGTVLTVCFLIGIGWIVYSWLPLSRQQVYDDFQTLHDEIESFSANGTDSQWKSLVARALRNLEPKAAILERSRSAANPLDQELYSAWEFGLLPRLSPENPVRIGLLQGPASANEAAPGNSPIGRFHYHMGQAKALLDDVPTAPLPEGQILNGGPPEQAVPLNMPAAAPASPGQGSRIPLNMPTRQER